MCSTVLPCPLCCQPNFQSVDSLRISLVNVTNRPLECPICCDVLFGLDKLTIHLFSHTLIKDSPVEKKVEEAPIESLPNSPRQTKIESLPSDETIENAEENFGKYHTHWHESPVSADVKPSPESQCDICGASFRTLELHRMHLKLVHEVSDEVIRLSDNVNGERDYKNCFQCHFCSKFFKMKGSLRVHLRVVHSFGKTGCSNVLPILNRIQNNSVANNNAKESSGANGLLSAENKLNHVEVKSWECDICAKSFTTKYFLKKHKRLHTGEQPYSCELCGKSFTFQQSYHKHLLYHSDDKPHICPTCGRAFKELSTLHNHERIHSGEKPFKCETCDKCFRQRVSYLVHRRIHTGSMPYKCTACEKSFRYKVSQRTHKCLAQPPGTVVRQTGDLLQRLIQSVALSNSIDDNNDSGDKDFQSLDEFVKESCDKIGIGDDGGIGFLENSSIELQIPSPSEKLQSLCLYSPSHTDSDLYGNGLEAINEVSFRQLLYGGDDVPL